MKKPPNGLAVSVGEKYLINGDAKYIQFGHVVTWLRYNLGFLLYCDRLAVGKNYKERDVPHAGAAGFAAQIGGALRNN